MTRQVPLFFALLLAAAICLPSIAADKLVAASRALSTQWPQWRGPLRDGISTDTGLLNEWPKDGPPLAWKATGLGAGFSSISIADGRIFTMGDRDGKQLVIALNLSDGKEQWTAPVGEPWEPNGYAGPRCTPTVDGALLYALGAHGDLVCLEAASGKELWRRDFKKDFGGAPPHWGFSESPLIDGDKVVCTPGGAKAGIVALNKKTGQDIWRAEIPELGSNGKDGAGYSSIVISEGAGTRQYVQLMGRGVAGVAADSGKFLWGYNRIANGTANIPTPLVHEDYVFCSTGYGAGAALLKLIPSGDGVNVHEEYFLEGKELQNHHGGMIMLGDYVYCGHGHGQGAPTCIEWKTGKIVWRQNRGPGTGSAAVAYADENLYFRYQNGVVALIGATPKGYEEKGTFQIPDVEKPSWPHPVIVGGKLYLREQDALLCYNVKK